ncbi:toxin-antitoxin system, toxin component [Streptomyces lunaelactis]|uniref:toxin-antitoxin system, toxin component n=1 Tax=Streptomyces lunaelactis TaxID=1535768 RepID=UPI0015844DD3|nr:toxin-antitoxin system, toxin component [Streptomyces lunaelactis]NUK02384.1 toxin-antitoxin system, toxin component [Streptomyces lunaelactis]NUK16391.1 toxin-antitoxin system, toxin component [Streptomyces lunaelactis]
MRELRYELAGALELAGPSRPDEVFQALCEHLSKRRGRPVTYHLVDFPPGTASGLYLDMTDRDIICIQARTSPWHQLVIFGHEVWHMIAGHCGQHETGSAVAVSLLEDGADMNSALQNAAARTDFRKTEESDAEFFGMELGAHLRTWVEGTESAAPCSGLAKRIQTSLGHRQG